VALTVSPPIRIAAIVGLVAALALGGFFMFMGKSGDASVPSTPIVLKHHPFGPGVKKASAPTAKVATPTHAKVSAKAAAPKVHVIKKAAERPAAELAAINAGLPLAVAHALGQHAVVVVELTNPESEVDGIAFAEARAGAAAAGVGFVPLNVLSQADVGKLTLQFGELLPDPGLLVYRRPAKLATRIDGFSDKDTVAQAAHNALVGVGP
jgi:hypothetical protein